MSDDATPALPVPIAEITAMEKRLNRLEDHDWRELKFKLERMEEEAENNARLVKLLLAMACCAIVYVPAVSWGPWFFLLFIGIIA